MTPTPNTPEKTTEEIAKELIENLPCWQEGDNNEGVIIEEGEDILIQKIREVLDTERQRAEEARLHLKCGWEPLSKELEAKLSEAQKRIEGLEYQVKTWEVCSKAVDRMHIDKITDLESLVVEKDKALRVFKDFHGKSL